MWGSDMGLVIWFNRKTKLEKLLLCAVVLLAIVVLILFICFLTSNDNAICTKPECIRAAVHILDTVNPNADPCDDFYAFACGNFIKQAMSKGQPTPLYSLNEVTENQLKEIIEETRNETGLPKSLIYQRAFYRACTDTESIEEDENRTFLRLLDELIGGWPVLKMTNWTSDHFTWQNTMLKARKLGLYHQFFFRVEIYENHTNDETMLWIRPPDSREIDSFYVNDTYVDMMYDIAKGLGATSVDITSELRTTTLFAERLKEIATKANNRTLPYNHEFRKNITVRDINHLQIKINWADFLSKLTGIPIRDSDQIVFDIDDYLTDFYYLILQKSKRIQANYIAWIILSTNIKYLSQDIREKYNQILIAANTTIPKDTRSDQCHTLSIGLFRYTAEAEYIRRYTTPEKRKVIKTMISYIKSDMVALIEATQWIDEHSRSNALKRLQNITEAIGWLDFAFNVTKLEHLTGFDKIKKLPDKRQTAIDLAKLALKINYDNQYHNIKLKRDSVDRVGIPKMEVNAYYIRVYNVLILPTPILQEQMFDINRPQYMNYGALGSVIGHELSHGFSLYYNLGDDIPVDDIDDNPLLWSNATAKKRMEIVQCVDDEYNNFLKAQGRNMTNHTVGEENIADFNGVNIAYTAYQNWIRNNGHEPSLPGVKFTPNQIFWIMASTYMCFEPKLSKKDKILGRDRYHGIPEFRVVGRIKHSPYFANDFNCAQGSKMNPKDKCRIFV